MQDEKQKKEELLEMLRAEVARLLCADDVAKRRSCLVSSLLKRLLRVERCSMSSFQVVAEKVAQVASLTAGFVSQAASSLVGNAEKLSLDEISRRLDGALRALRGEEVSTSGAATTSLTTAKTSLQLAHEMVESYTFDKKTGVSTFTVPAGVTDVEAMKALNEYFRKNLPNFERDVVYARDLDWYENYRDWETDRKSVV